MSGSSAPTGPAPPPGTGPGAAPRSEAEAVASQRLLRDRLVLDEAGPPADGTGTVAGVDVAYDDARDLVAAAVVVLDAASLEVVAEATAVGPVSFPYVPGLLAFREVPAVLRALDRLAVAPDLVVCDGYGLAHPRRFGLACHLGVVTGLPTIGVAKSPFVFRHDEPGAERGASSPLLDGDEEVGRALRTRAGVRPVFVSAGHRVGLDTACAHVMRSTPRYRQPEPIRRADRSCREALSAAVAADAGEPARPRG